LIIGGSNIEKERIDKLIHNPSNFNTKIVRLGQ